MTRAASVLGAIVLVCFGLAPRSAVAQSRFGIDVTGGVSLPLSPSVHRTVAIDLDETADSQMGTTTLLDRRNRPGLLVGVGVQLISNSARAPSLELRYTFEQLAWANDRLRCEGDRPALLLPNGEVSDAEVRYDCSVAASPVATGANEPPLRFHHLTIGPRFYLQPGARRRAPNADFYLVVAPGLALVQFEDRNLGRQFRPGLGLAAGGGVDIALEQKISVNVDLRYRMSMVRGAGSSSARSSRAVATGANVLGALMDVFHRAAITVGVRFLIP